MFDNLTRKMAEKMGRTVKEAAKPYQEEVKKTVDAKVDLYSKILRLGVLLMLFVEGTRRIASDDPPPQGPGTVIINNYLHGKDGEG